MFMSTAIQFEKHILFVKYFDLKRIKPYQTD